MSERKVPKIRFPGFTDDWEQRKVGELVKEHNAGIYISKENYGEGINVIGVGNIYDNDIFDGEIYRLGPVNDDKFLLDEGDLIYGESSLVLEGIARTVCVGKNGAGSAFAWHTRRVKLDNDFVDSHFATLELNYHPVVRKHLMSVATQTALTGMTTDGYFSAPLFLPSVPEQKKISEVFKSLDNLITLHQCELDKWKELKKGMLQKMFPKEGESVPEIRFSGFTDPWEQRKFSDFAQRESAFRSSSAEYPSIEYEDVVAEEGRLNKNVRKKETQKTGITFDGTQVLYGKLRPYLHNWLNPDFAGVAVGDWWVLRPVEMDKKFLYRLIQTQQFDEVANQSSGSKMPRADWNLVSNTDFVVPSSLEEQRQIAEAFDAIDDLITLHQRECDKWQTLKKALLQQMFV